MLKRRFQILAILGIIIISIVAFILPQNPYEIIPTLTIMSFDKPLWLCIIIGIGVPYLSILLFIYEKIIKEK